MALLLCMVRIAPPSPLYRRAAILPQHPVRRTLSSVAAITSTHNSQPNEAGWLCSATPVACCLVLCALCRCFGWSGGRSGRFFDTKKPTTTYRTPAGEQPSTFDAGMKLLALACWGVLWITHVASFLTPPPITAKRSASVAVSNAAGLVPPSPDELKAKAAAIREELKLLEANVAATNRPNADLVKPVPVREQAGGSQTLAHTSH